MIQQQTRALVFGAFMAALTVLFNAATYVVPVTFHLPLPVALATLRHGWRNGLLTAAVAAVLTFLFFGWPQVILLATAGLLPGLVLGATIRQGLRPSLAGLYTTLAALAGMLAGYAVGLLFLGEPPLEKLMAQMNQVLLEAFDKWAAYMPTPEQAEQFRQQGKLMAELLPNMIPLMFAFGAASAGLISYNLAVWMFPRLGHRVEPLPRFALWSLPRWVIWVYPLLLLPAFVAQYQGITPPPWLTKLNANVVLGVQFLFMLQGMSVASWWLQQRGWSVRAANWTGILAGYFLATITVFIGLFDLALDFRRLRGPRPWEEPST